MSLIQLRAPIVSEILEVSVLCPAGLSHWAFPLGSWSHGRVWGLFYRLAWLTLVGPYSFTSTAVFALLWDVGLIS